MKSRRADRGEREIDRSKFYVYGAFGGLLLALVGVWLTPVAAEIGRREMDVFYGVGWFALVTGSVVAFLCIVLSILDS